MVADGAMTCYPFIMWIHMKERGVQFICWTLRTAGCQRRYAMLQAWAHGLQPLGWSYFEVMFRYGSCTATNLDAQGTSLAAFIKGWWWCAGPEQGTFVGWWGWTLRVGLHFPKVLIWLTKCMFDWPWWTVVVQILFRCGLRLKHKLVSQPVLADQPVELYGFWFL